MDAAATTAAIILSLYVAPLAMAAGWDATSYRIPNWLTSAMALAFVPAALCAPVGVDWLGHVGAGALAFAVAAGCFALRALGGGDVKLIGATALWLGFGPLLDFALVMGIVGGVLTLAILAARHWFPMVQPMLPAGLAVSPPRLLTAGQGVPYGIAIAAAGLLVADRLPLLA